MLYTSPHFVPLDSAGKPMPGAKLTFSMTGTSTLQNVYQDVDLTVAHLNPVTADNDGVFPLIYLDPSLPNYRATLKTAAGVQVDQQDDIPSNETTGQSLRLKSAAPEIILEETDGSLNNKKWSIRANAEVLTIDLLSDSESIRNSILQITRSGSSLNTFNFLAAPKIQGERISAHLLAFKLSATDRPTQTTETADPDLTLSLEASATYQVDVSIIFTGITTGTQGLKYLLGYTGSLTTVSQAMGYRTVNGVGTVSPPFTATGSNSFGTIAVNPTVDGMAYTLLIQTNTQGTLSFNWCQSSSSANATRVGLGSFLAATRLA